MHDRDAVVLPPPLGARALSNTIGTDMTPMSIADRVEADALKSGKLENLKGKGQPLDLDRETQGMPLPKNMEARAEYEMRTAERNGMLSNLGHEGKPLPDRHVGDSRQTMAAISQHAQQATQGGVAPGGAKPHSEPVAIPRISDAWK